MGVFEFVTVISLGFIGFLGFIIYCIFKLLSQRRESDSLTEDEAKLLQDLWDGLQKMETRVNNLETILRKE